MVAFAFCLALFWAFSRFIMSSKERSRGSTFFPPGEGEAEEEEEEAMVEAIFSESNGN